MPKAPFVLAGEIDLAVADQLREQLIDYLAGQDAARPEVLIDCTELTFIDSSGLAALVTASNHTSSRMVLKGLSPGCRRPFEISGLDKIFTID